MVNQRAYIAFALGVLVILSSSFLPISKTRVASHTIDKVVRKLIGEIKGTIPAGTRIRLSFKLDPAVESLRIADRAKPIGRRSNLSMPPV